MKNLALITLIALTTTVAQARQPLPKSIYHSVCGPIATGGEIPVPYTRTQKFDLADGESYYLVGRLLSREGHPYLQLDLDTHPHLATRKTSVDPFFPLTTTSGSRLKGWEKLEGKTIRVKVRADGYIVKKTRGNRDYSYYRIVLQLLAKPVKFDIADCDLGYLGDD